MKNCVLTSFGSYSGEKLVSKVRAVPVQFQGQCNKKVRDDR
jgi:hypothetical protein